MGQIVRVVKVGTGLYARIPGRLARELAIRRRDYVLVERGQGPRLTLRKVEVADATPEPRAGR